MWYYTFTGHLIFTLGNLVTRPKNMSLSLLFEHSVFLLFEHESQFLLAQGDHSRITPYIAQNLYRDANSSPSKANSPWHESNDFPPSKKKLNAAKEVTIQIYYLLNVPRLQFRRDSEHNAPTLKNCFKK